MPNCLMFVYVLLQMCFLFHCAAHSTLKTMVYRHKDHVSSVGNTHATIKVLCKQRSGLKICHINSQSLKNKIDEFRYIFESSSVDIICISETWFKPCYTDNLFNMNGYNLFRCDRHSHGGGVAIYIKNSIKSRSISNSRTEDEIEYLFIEVVQGVEKLLIGSIYRPNRNVNISSFTELLHTISLPYSNIILTGDFNCNVLCDDSLPCELRTLGLNLVNFTLPTHYIATSNTLLDLFFVSDVSKTLMFDQLSVPVFSKHDLIFLVYDFQPITSTQTITYRDFKNINYEQLGKKINTIDWSCVYCMESAEDQITYLENNLTLLFDEFVPYKKTSTSMV